MWWKKQKNEKSNSNHTTTPLQPEKTNHEDISQYLDDLEQPFQKKELKIKKSPSNNTQKKRHLLLHHNLKGKPVFLQDTGKQIGTILDEFNDVPTSERIYQIQDIETQHIYSLDAQYFEDHPDGLIYIPSWYSKGKSIIEQLEFTDRINPELQLLLNDTNTSTDDLFDVFIKDDHDLTKQLQKSKTTYHLLNSRLHLLQKERSIIKQHIFDIIEQRLIKNLPRKDFADQLQQHQDKANLLDLHITRCKNLIKRLEKTSFGKLIEKTNSPINQAKQNNNHKQYQQDKEINHLKTQYQKLEQEYNELLDKHTRLKHTIEKLINNDY